MKYNKTTPEELLIVIKEDYQELSKKLPTEIPAHKQLDIEDNTKLPLLVESVLGSIKYRVVDIAGTAIQLLEDNELLPSVVLVRCVFESVALHFLTSAYMKKAIERKKLGHTKQHLIRIAYGSRVNHIKDSQENNIVAKNILDAIDEVDKLPFKFRESYDFISEYVHPNYSGVLKFYSMLSEDKSTIIFSKKKMYKVIDEPRLYPLHLLAGTLGLLLRFEVRVENLMPDFIKLCNEE